MSVARKPLHTVVRVEEFGNLKVLCFDDFGRPMIYGDEADAELSAAKLRDKHPTYKFAVVDGDIL